MTLIKSISGTRGTIGFEPGNNLTPLDIVEMSAAYATIVLLANQEIKPTVIVGRDARISGQMVSQLCIHTLAGMGINVLDAGLSTTPAVETAVPRHHAQGGIIITASHNPREWNALKFLNEKGEFISALDGAEIIEIANQKLFNFADVDHLGTVTTITGIIDEHIHDILLLPLVRVPRIKEQKYKIVVDCINSTGAISIKPLLEQLSCEVVLINEEMTGDFAHNPEPLPANLIDLCAAVKHERADLGIAVDPDVDRLSFVCPDGTLLGEENTLVAVAKYILKHTPGATVSNLSSTRGLADITQEVGQKYYSAAVGEVNVVNKMKDINAVIGGEGNGGVIYPTLHYGRDALVGVALLLSYLATEKITLNDLKNLLPKYEISKNKLALDNSVDTRTIISQLADLYANERINIEDGLKIDFPNGWVQLRQSNTEPIIRIYSEAPSMDEADKLANQIITDFQKLINNE